MSPEEDQLILAYQKMADLTLPECKFRCRNPLSCCAPEHCAEVISWAKERWNVVLQPTGHPRLPLLGKDGCTAAPHLRPACTVHTCEINSVGCKRGDIKWTERYFEIREEIEQLELEIYDKRTADGVER